MVVTCILVGVPQAWIQIMKNYLELLQKVLKQGTEKTDRTHTGTRALFAEQLRFNLSAGFPLLTTKKMPFKNIVTELLWFLKGDTNLKYLHQHNCHIWDPWANAQGDLGPIYGKQWRAWKTPEGAEIDQMSELLHNLKTNPASRRLLVSAWNPSDLPQEQTSYTENIQQGKMALAACHSFFQCYVVQGRLSLQLYARSQDLFIGTPFNLASYALLLHLLALHAELEVGELVWTAGDAHLYNNHLALAKIQIGREPLALPQLKITQRRKTLFDHEPSDFQLEDYQAHPKLSAKVAV